MSVLTDFYLRDGLTTDGLSFEQMIGSSDEELEKCHNFVQWLFPLDEPSLYNPTAPILTPEDISLISLNGFDNFYTAIARFLRFYGMKVEDRRFSTDTSFAGKAQLWLTPKNHNLKRITRIIRSATIFGWKALALRLSDGFVALQDTTAGSWLKEEAQTIKFWNDAVELPVGEKLNTANPKELRDIPDKELLAMASVFNTGYTYLGFRDDSKQDDGTRYEVFKPDDASDASITIEARGNNTWAICSIRSCLSKDGEWEFESMPSNRQEDFIERTRFKSLQEAFRFFRKYVDDHPPTAEGYLKKHPEYAKA